ncbi:MAG: hypothetical protein K6F34_03185, partial [Lachnospiraceae bacterium]|nr:hypothetical protein [Lachnospiraceae bacterium]
MKKRKMFKSFIAMTALVAMLLENTYSVMAQVNTEVNVDNGIEADIQSDDRSDSEIDVSDEIRAEEGSSRIDEELSDDETPSKEIDINVETGQDIEEEDEAEIAASSVNAYSDRIGFVGMKDTTLYINTDRMNSTDSFKLDIKAASSVSYDGKLNGTLTKASGGVYYVSGLNGADASVKAVELNNGLKAEYKVRSDGNPQISLISKDAPKASSVLRITDNGYEIKGSGYEDVTLSIDGNALSKGSFYSLYIKTKAEVMYNGRYVTDGVIPLLSASTKSIRLSNLNNEAFSIYIKGDNGSNILAAYSIDSVDNGAFSAVLSESASEVVLELEDSKEEQDKEDKEEAAEEDEDSVKRVYEYEDARVSIAVTLNDPADLPDDAVLNAKE